jgi:hypothetical protein
VCCGTSEPDWQPLLFAPIDPKITFSSDDVNDLIQKFAQGLGFFPFVLPIGLATTVDTSTCGFLNTPCYSARVTGPRIRRFTRTISDGESSQTANIDIVLDGFVQIVDPQPKSFIANILLMGQLIAPNRVQRAATFGAALGAIDFLSHTDLNSDAFKQQMQDVVNKLFKDSRNETTGDETGWRLVWMGVED